MSYGIADLLHYEELMDAYQSSASINAQNPFFDMYTASPVNEDSATVKMVKFTDTRKAAPINQRGVSARTLQQVGASEVAFTCIHAFNEIVYKADQLEFLREPSSQVLQDRGMAEIRRQMDLFAKQHRNLKVATLAKVLGDGVVYYDADGGILESSSNAAFTVDFSVGATHKTQLAHASNGSADIIGTAWDNAAAPILTDLAQIRAAAEYDEVPMPQHVWLPEAGKFWIIGNTEIKSFVSNVMPGAANFLDAYARTNNMIQIGDWFFHFGSWTYVGADGSTKRNLLQATKAIITPTPDPSWWININGPETIPTEVGVISSIEEYTSKTTRVFGDFIYAAISDNPLGLAARFGTNFFYGPKDPNCLWMPTVDF